MTTDEIKNLVADKAYQCGINPDVAIVQVARESANFRPDVVFGPFIGGAGEKGMTQFVPGTWARFGSGPHNNAYNPEMAMDAYCRYMGYLLRMFDQDYQRALQGYNGGEGNVQRGTVSSRARAYASEVLAQANANQYTVPTVEPAPVGFVPIDQTESEADGIPTWAWIALAAVGIVLIAR